MVFYLSYGEYRGVKNLKAFYRYVMARYEAYKRDYIFKVYVADSMYYQAQNKCLNIRYAELIDTKPVDTRTGDEIAEDVIARLGLRFNNGCI